MKNRQQYSTFRTMSERILAKIREKRKEYRRLNQKKEMAFINRARFEVPAFAEKTFRAVSQSAKRNQKSVVVCVDEYCQGETAIRMANLKIYAVEALLRAHAWGYRTHVVRTACRHRSQDDNRALAYKIELKISWR